MGADYRDLVLVFISNIFGDFMSSRRLVYVQNVIRTLERRFGFYSMSVMRKGHLVLSDKNGNFITLPPAHEYTSEAHPLYEHSYVEDLYEHITIMLNGTDCSHDPDPDHDAGFSYEELNAVRKKKS